MKNVEHCSSSVVVRADDPSLTGSAGLVCVAEAVRALGVVEAIDGFVGPIKQRNRGLGAGEFVVSVAECLLGGGDFLADLDRSRADTAAGALRAVARRMIVGAKRVKSSRPNAPRPIGTIASPRPV